jgi:hypothetical protein
MNTTKIICRRLRTDVSLWKMSRLEKLGNKERGGGADAIIKWGWLGCHCCHQFASCCCSCRRVFKMPALHHSKLRSFSHRSVTSRLKQQVPPTSRKVCRPLLSVTMQILSTCIPYTVYFEAKNVRPGNKTTQTSSVLAYDPDTHECQPLLVAEK